MSDLRDRIAAVVHRYSVPIPMAQLAADAVIAELHTIRCWKCDNTVHVKDEQKGDDGRYAWARPDDWKADE